MMPRHSMTLSRHQDKLLQTPATLETLGSTSAVHMWERVCDQPRRHTGQLRRTGDSEQGSIYAELLGLF